MGPIRAVISDFGGVLTSPLEGAMRDVFDRVGVTLAELGISLVALTEAGGANPLFELESGRLSETEFLEALEVPAAEAVFVDDLEINCETATQLGLHAVRFRDSAQAIADTRAVLAAAA